MKKLKFVCLALTIILFALGFFARYFTVSFKEDGEISIYTSCYPLYAFTSLIVEGAPDLSVNILSQPQINGYEAYYLSDWEEAILDNASAFVVFGDGFEAYSTGLGLDNTIIINALSGLEILDYEESDIQVLEMQDDAISVNPYLYMSCTGAIDICEAICANMCTIDEDYSYIYLNNLNAAYDKLSELELLCEEFSAKEGIRVAVGQPAFYYALRDLGIRADAIILRSFGKTSEDIDTYISMLIDGGITHIIVENECPDELVSALENAEIRVIKLDNMLLYTEIWGSEAYFEAYTSNFYKLCEELGT